MLKHIAAGAALAFALGACALIQPDEKLAPQPQAQAVELTKEQSGRFIAFVGPKLQHTGPFLGVSDTNYFALRSWVDNKTGETAHQLYVEDSYYGGPYLWNGASDADNKKLKFIPISRNQISCDEGCAYADEFAAELPEDYLRAHQDGIAVTFTSSSGKTLAVRVPPNLVVEEIKAVDQVRMMAANAANAPPSPTPASPGPTPAPTPPPAAATPNPPAATPGATAPSALNGR
jgi:hypothetical protein